MGRSNIEWTDFTFNPWIGCEKVSPGCKFCYAERQNRYTHWVDNWQGSYKLTSEKNWSKVYKWNREEPGSLVFCASLSDVFDKNVDPTWRDDLWQLTRMTPNLTWLILTKRSNEMLKMVHDGVPENVWLGVSVENNDYLYRVEDLIEVKERENISKVFISAEPLIGYIQQIDDYLPDIDWVIAGGESGHSARFMPVWWARNLLESCQKNSVPFFMKQMGSAFMKAQGFTGKGNGLLDIPKELRIREFPQVEE
ncbi:MAG: DUF5131 family protein [Planctomycetota bacterium]|jgi:protein gp37